MVFALLLIGGMLLFFVYVCLLVAKFTRTDTIHYDLTFLWDRFDVDRKRIEYRL